MISEELFYPTTTHPVIFLPIHSGFYPSKRWLHKAMLLRINSMWHKFIYRPIHQSFGTDDIYLGWGWMSPDR